MKSSFLLRRVVGRSMLPTLNGGQLIVVYCGRWRVGDVVLLRHNGLEKIKRVVQIDGARVFVVGDNEAQSTDSRHFGWLPRASVRGKVVWPRKAGAKR